MQQIAVCNEKFCEVAKIISCFKLDGEIKTSSKFVFDDLSEILSISKYVYIYNKNIFPVKTKLQNFRLINDLFVMKLNNFDNINVVEQFIGSSLYVKKEILDDFLKKSKHPYSIVGFSVFDFSNKYLAKVKSVIVEKQNKILLDSEEIIPYVDEFISEIDYDNYKIVLNKLPKGLIKNA